MKTTRNNLILLFALLLHTTAAVAQVNPQPGYIITNGGDTIHGTIDFKSAARSAKACSFMAEGSGSYKTYSPGEIKAYRHSDNGVFYVTMDVPVDGKTSKVFAEYLLQGGVSLYRLDDNGTEYYYMVDEEGRMATVKPPSSLARNDREEQRAKREALAEASRLLAKSGKAVEQMWRQPITAENLTKTVQQYDNEYCKESGECVVFRYDPKKSREIVIKLRLLAGVSVFNVKMEPNHSSLVGELRSSCATPRLGCGADFTLPRKSRHLYLQAMLSAGYWNVSEYSKEFYYDKEDQHCVLRCVELEEQLGAACLLLPGSRVSPFIRGGVSIAELLKLKDEHIRGWQVGNHVFPQVTIGFYAGAGVELPLGKRRVAVAVEYKKAKSWESCMKVSGLSLHASIRL